MQDLLTRLFIISASAAATAAATAAAMPLPASYAELPREARIAIAEMEATHPVHDNTWDTFNREENEARTRDTRILPEYIRALWFSRYPLGGYLTLTERDIVGDARPEYIYQVIVMSEGLDKPEPLFVFSAEGNFLYSIPATMLRGRKVGSSFRGEWVRYFDGEYSPEGEACHYWWQWELTEHHARRCKWHTSESREPTRFNNYIVRKDLHVAGEDELYQGMGCKKEKYSIANVTKDKGDKALRLCRERIEGLSSASENEQYEEESPQQVIHVTSVAECFMTPSITWHSFTDATNAIDAAVKWNEVSAEALKKAATYTCKELRKRIRTLSCSVQPRMLDPTGPEDCYPIFPTMLKTEN